MPDHIVKKNETVSGLAKRFGVSQQAILDANPHIAPPDYWLNEGGTITIPEKPTPEEVAGGNQKANGCGNVFGCYIDKEIYAEAGAPKFSIGEKTVPSLERQQTLIFDNTPEESFGADIQLEFGENKFELLPQYPSETTIFPPSNNYVGLTMQWNMDAGQCRAADSSQPIYPHVFNAARQHMGTVQDGYINPSIKQALAKAEAQAAQAERTEVQIIEVPPTIPEGVHDLDDDVFVETVAKALTNALYLNHHSTTSVLSLTYAMVALNTGASRKLFWQQLLLKTKVQVTYSAGKAYMYFHGGPDFQTMIKANKQQAYKLAFDKALKMMAKSDPDTWAKNIDALTDAAKARVDKARNTFVQMNAAYRMGKNTTKIAMMEQFVASSVGDGLKKAAGKGNIIGLVIVVGVESFKFFSQPASDRYLSDYLSMIGVALVKFVIASAAALLVGTVLTIAAAPAALVVGVGIVVAFGIGWLLDIADEEYGWTEKIKKVMRDTKASDGEYEDPTQHSEMLGATGLVP